MMRRGFHTSRATLVYGLVEVLLLVAIGAVVVLELLAAPGHATVAAAPREPAAPAVAVAPEVGRPTEPFVFSLAGFAADETVSVSFTAPPGFDDLGFPTPDAMTTAVDASGAGSLTMRPVDQGLILPGTWVVTFTGQTSAAVQTASFELVCGC